MNGYMVACKVLQLVTDCRAGNKDRVLVGHDISVLAW